MRDSPFAGILRREFLAKVTAAGGAAFLASWATPLIEKAYAIPKINVRDFGALGDGITDDSAAIKTAQAALVAGASLYFPPGNYRFATQNPVGHAAITLTGLSNISVEFDSGAQLTMDNLSNGSGTSHGIRIVGAASDITLINPTIVWQTAPSNRSEGDGIHVVGYPSDAVPPRGWIGSTGPVSDLTIINARIVNAPQTGAVIMGCSDVAVQGFAANSTLADGLHFNACRRITVNGHHAVNTGDDGLAFVTYYDASDIYDSATEGPFNQPSLGDWNNSGSASAISVENSATNGIRVQGDKNLSITGAQITNCKRGTGVIVNSAIVGGSYAYSGLASQNITISGINIDTCNSGIEIQAGNIETHSPAMYYTFSVDISEVVIRNCPNSLIFTCTSGLESAIRSGITTRGIT